MRIEKLDYELPAELVAQEPLARRDAARMLVVFRKRGTFAHSRFYKLPSHLREGDLLVLNDTRVVPARVFARKPTGGRIELLFVRPTDDASGTWLAMVRTHRLLREGTRLVLDDGRVLRLAGCPRPGRVLVASEDSASLDEIIRSVGTLALPHYIRREPGPADLDDYQTVYASQEGAIAAPTAGLHFTEQLFQALREVGVRSTFLTLHIGPATFAPLRTAEVERHSMEAEWYTIPAETEGAIGHARRTGGQIVAVGTSSVRALESYAITGDRDGFTGLFIYPGFGFKLVDAMVTNFHTPRSSVLALVMALAGRELILAAYREAIRHRYRLLSYGDAMLIL